MMMMMRVTLLLATLLAVSHAFVAPSSIATVRSQASRSSVVMGANSGRFCQMTGKGPNNANSISFSHKVTARKQGVNLHAKRYFSAELNGWIRMKLACKTMKTIDKYGIDKTAKKYGVDLNKYKISSA